MVEYNSLTVTFFLFEKEGILPVITVYLHFVFLFIRGSKRSKHSNAKPGRNYTVTKKKPKFDKLVQKPKRLARIQ